MQRATYLVLDEADRMFDMGFEGQVSLCLLIPDLRSWHPCKLCRHCDQDSQLEHNPWYLKPALKSVRRGPSQLQTLVSSGHKQHSS